MSQENGHHHDDQTPPPDKDKPEVRAAPKGIDLYTCPMHPEVKQAGPGSCPKCGMALEAETPAAMSFSSVSVIGNALRLRKVKI